MIRIKAGTGVAIWPTVMRLSETMTIYLAAGAPFGVHYFLRKQHDSSGARALLKAIGMALLWPLAATRLLFLRELSAREAAAAEAADVFDAQLFEKIERAKRETLAALYRVRELARACFGLKSEKVEHAACAIRESVEKYVGLTLAAGGADVDAPPVERELALCRIAGRTGDDLLLAGRCIHRRNAARLIEHQKRARAELLQAIADVSELISRTSDASSTNAVAARYAGVALLKFYSHVLNLLSLLEDECAVRSVARLLDAEAARLRHLEAVNSENTNERAPGDEQCATRRSPVLSHD